MVVLFLWCSVGMLLGRGWCCLLPLPLRCWSPLARVCGLRACLRASAAFGPRSSFVTGCSGGLSFFLVSLLSFDSRCPIFL
uniref:Putative secreted protein n=1 Tax=Anopheles darlingi TaxID=43151 RepID=A0A2M4D0T9_ANODA